MSFTAIVAIPACIATAAVSGFASYEYGRLALFYFKNYSAARDSIFQTCGRANSLLGRAIHYPGLAIQQHQAIEAFNNCSSMAAKSLGSGTLALTAVAVICYILKSDKAKCVG